MRTIFCLRRKFELNLQSVNSAVQPPNLTGSIAIPIIPLKVELSSIGLERNQFIHSRNGEAEVIIAIVVSEISQPLNQKLSIELSSSLSSFNREVRIRNASVLISS